jgi:hypothetical protein
MFGQPAKRSIIDYLGGRKSGHLFQTQRIIQRGSVCRTPNSWVGYWKNYKDQPMGGRLKQITLGKLSVSKESAWSTFRKLVPEPDIGHRRDKPSPLSRHTLFQLIRVAGNDAGLGRLLRDPSCVSYKNFLAIRHRRPPNSIVLFLLLTLSRVIGAAHPRK